MKVVRTPEIPPWVTEPIPSGRCNCSVRTFSRVRLVRISLALAAASLGACDGSGITNAASTKSESPLNSPRSSGAKTALTPLPAGVLRGTFAYADLKGNIYTVSVDGSNRKLVHRSGPETDLDVSFSPDARKVVFRSTTGNFPDPTGTGLDTILVVDRATGQARSIAPHGGLFPDWSPVANVIAFSGVDHKKEYIYLASSDGFGLRGTRLRGEGAQWSPDGRQMTLAQFPPGTIQIARVRTGKTRTIARFDGQASAEAWSPDGKKLVGTTGVPGKNWDMWILHASGKTSPLLPTPDQVESASAWLPGGWILYCIPHRNDLGGDWRVYNLVSKTTYRVPALAPATSDPVDWSPVEWQPSTP